MKFHYNTNNITMRFTRRVKKTSIRVKLNNKLNILNPLSLLILASKKDYELYKDAVIVNTTYSNSNSIKKKYELQQKQHIHHTQQIRKSERIKEKRILQLE